MIWPVYPGGAKRPKNSLKIEDDYSILPHFFALLAVGLVSSLLAMNTFILSSFCSCYRDGDECLPNYSAFITSIANLEADFLPSFRSSSVSAQ